MLLTLSPTAYQIPWLLLGGAFDIKKGVISDAMLLYSICLFVYLGVSPSQPANPQLGAEIALLSV